MDYVTFKDDEKVKMFDKIAGYFYNANFGQASKADIELLMFDFYIKKMIHDNQEDDGTIDYSKCSDYKISKDLGITQQRVQNLKVKNQLVNPIEYDWKASLAKLTKNARYDSETRKVTLNIPDPNLYYEIQNFIEETGGYVDIKLNKKILQLRVEYYIDLVVALEPESSRKEIIKAIKKSLSESNKENSSFDENNIGKSLLSCAANVTAIAANISSIMSPTNIIGKALCSLLM